MVGYGAQWLLSLSHALKILGLGKALEDERWLGKGEEGYVRSGMGTERGAWDKRWGHCGKGGQILRRARRNSGASSLSYLLACLPRGMCARQGGAPRVHWAPDPILPQVPSYFLSLPLAPSASKLFSPPACVLTSLALLRLPPDSAVPSTTAVPEGGISAPGRLIHPAAHPGRHVALLLPFCGPPSVAAGLPDRGEVGVLWEPAALHPHP